MSFQKIRSIKVSERVFDLVCEELDLCATEYNKKIWGYLQTFNNCREQGYYLTISSIADFNDKQRTKEDMYVWACECRNSDEIMIVISYKHPRINGMFDEEAYENRRFFGYDELQPSADFIINQVKKHFAYEMGK
jgi:hypothetical protein